MVRLDKGGRRVVVFRKKHGADKWTDETLGFKTRAPPDLDSTLGTERIRGLFIP